MFVIIDFSISIAGRITPLGNSILLPYMFPRLSYINDKIQNVQSYFLSSPSSPLLYLLFILIILTS